MDSIEKIIDGASLEELKEVYKVLVDKESGNTNNRETLKKKIKNLRNELGVLEKEYAEIRFQRLLRSESEVVLDAIGKAIVEED